MLPANHKAMAWALGGELANIDDAMIADLGGHAVCAEMLKYMKVKADKPEQRTKPPSKSEKVSC